MMLRSVVMRRLLALLQLFSYVEILVDNSDEELQKNDCRCKRDRSETDVKGGDVGRTIGK